VLCCAFYFLCGPSFDSWDVHGPSYSQMLWFAGPQTRPSPK
jgi:hypothetical protein